jgi:hypothetical protein
MLASVPTSCVLLIYSEPTTTRGFVMTDVSVYYFMRRSGPGGKALLSKRRATLASIKGKGEAVVQSRRIVDHTEVDGNGFVIGGVGDGSHPIDELWPHVRSLELRAKSRDDEALKIAEGGESDRKNRLHLESLELRKQARVLRNRIDQARVDSQGNQGRAQDSIGYGPSPQPG